MPFGCLTLGEKKDYNSPTEITDRYDLGQIVKSEEFCEIFRAKDKTTSKMYTCKKFLKKDGRKVRKAAKNEIFILKMVKHPNILQLVDVYETRKEYFLFLELATGREVFDWILDQGYYSEKDTSNVIRQVMEAVAYLHSLNIVHRNLKLENLVYYNRLKHSKIVISDFHLAKLENGLIKEPCGTPEYLAPEVVGRQRYGRPVDCWALGVIMYILLSGNPPFYDEADDDDYENHDKNLFRKILAGDYEFDSPYWDDISDSAKSLVSRLMEVDQDQRLTAQEAINHEWISGNAASDKNIKENVCAQIEKNFAKAKWKVVIMLEMTFFIRHRLVGFVLYFYHCALRISLPARTFGEYSPFFSEGNGSQQGHYLSHSSFADFFSELLFLPPSATRYSQSPYRKDCSLNGHLRNTSGQLFPDQAPVCLNGERPKYTKLTAKLSFQKHI
uniref:CaM kinase-like vesicle-associated protein n=1 Tax=Pygocentrus nattereri TaxID=42514 RepID=A0AAR2L2S6_PYGNA